MALLKLAITGAVGFGLLTALLYAAQRSLMYFPERVRVAPSAAGFPVAEEIALDSAGERVIAWHVPPQAGRPVVVYFHGNGGSLRYRVHRFRKLIAEGFGLIALSYRGYGGSTGSPTETGLIADGEAAYAFAAARYPAERIALWGESLGSAVAVAVAAKRTVGAVVLEAPFTSAADVGARTYWFLPVRLLMKDTFRSDLRIGRVSAPVLVMHGTGDEVVPFALGERLFALAREPKRFVRFDGAGHNGLDDHGGFDAARAFLTMRRP